MKVIDIGELIKSERKKKGMTQADLADDLCTIATLSRIENGLHLPKSDVLFGLLERLEISEYRLLGPMLDDSDFDANVHFLKDKIERLCSEDSWVELRTCLDELNGMDIGYNPTDKQFLVVYETIYNYENNRRDLIRFDDLSAAMSLTVSDFSVDSLIDFNLTTYEQYLLIFMAYCLIRDGEMSSVPTILGNLKTSLESTISKKGLWTKPVFYYYEMHIDYYIDNKNYKLALESILNRKEYCLKQHVFSKCPTYAYEEILCCTHLNMLPEARERLLTNYFHLLGIKKVEEAEAFRTRIKEDFGIEFKIVERRNK